MRDVRRCTQLVVFCLVVAFLAVSASAAPVPRSIAQGDVPGEYIVGLNVPPASVDTAAREIARKAGGTVVAVWKHALTGFWIRVPAERAHLLLLDRRVVSVEQNARVYNSGSQRTGLATNCSDSDEDASNDCLRPTPSGVYPAAFQPHPLWYLTRINNRTLSFAKDASGAFTYTYLGDGSGVVAYIVDAGMSRFHQEFVLATVTEAGDHATPAESPRILEVEGSNGIHARGGEDIRPSSAHHTDCAAPPLYSPLLGGLRWNYLNPWLGAGSSHGTAVASVLGGRNIGVAKGVQIIPVKAIGCNSTGTAADIISAFEFIKANEQTYYTNTGRRRPAVVSISTFRSPNQIADVANTVGTPFPVVMQLETAVQGVTDYGIPVFASANNQKRDACEGTPGRLSRRGGKGSVITVGGLDKSGDVIWVKQSDEKGEAGSNFGPCIDIMAPADMIVLARDRAWNAYPATTENESYSGTSYAAPIVAGIAARLMSEDPSLTQNLGTDLQNNRGVVETVWKRLEESATRLPEKNGTPPGTPLGENSPNLIAYAGAFTLTAQPKSENLIGTRSTTLTVALPSGVTTPSYEWFKSLTNDYASSQRVGTTATYAVTLPQPVIPGDPVREWYWVRVTATRAGSSEQMSVDSAMAAISTGCAVIKTQPKSLWLSGATFQDADVLTIELENPAAGLTVKWYEGVRGNTSSHVGTGLTLSLKDVPTPDPAPSVRTFWARVTGTNPNTCTVDSDVAQVRLCNQVTVTTPLDLETGSTTNTVPITFSAPNATTYFLMTGDRANPTILERTTSNSFRITALTTRQYWIRAQNECSYADSGDFTITQTACHDLSRSGGSLEVTSPAAYAGEPVAFESSSIYNIADQKFDWKALPYRDTVVQDLGTTRTNGFTHKPTKTTYYTAVISSCTTSLKLKPDVVLVRPEFETHPVTQSALRGSTVVLTALGRDPSDLQLEYKWFRIDGDTPVELTTEFQPTARLELTNVQRTERYFVRAKNKITLSGEVIPGFPAPSSKTLESSTDSRVAVVTVVCSAPKRRSVRATSSSGDVSLSSTATVGQIYTFTVDEPEADVTYRWFAQDAGGVREVDTGISITVQPMKSTTYWYQATRTCPDGSTAGPIDGDRYDVTIVCPLTLEGPDDVVKALSGTSTTIGVEVEATGYGPFTYEWYVDGAYKPAFTGSAYSWTSPTPGQQNVYVKVTDACGGTATSRTATLTITSCVVPKIGAYWGSGWVYVGGQGHRVGVSMDPQSEAYTYQWYRGDGTPINGKTDPEEILTTYDLDSYYVIIKDGCGNVIRSKTVYLYVYGECLLPPLTVGQSATSIPAGGSVTFSAACDFNDVTFQWYFGNSGDTRNPITNATSAKYNATTPGPYWVRASRSCDAHVDSETLMFTEGACKPNVITQHPQSSDVDYGATGLTLSVAAADAAAKNFFWHKAEDPTTVIATGQTLALPSPLTESGRYVALVRDQTCASTPAAESFPATVRVASCSSITPPTWVTEQWAVRNDPITLTATSSGATGYQWYKGEVGDTRNLIPNGTSAVYITDDITADTQYWVRIFGNGCIVDSPTINVRVCDPPAFAPSFHPNQNIVAGQTTRFWANATGTDLSYEWFEGPSGNTSKPIGRNIDMIEMRPHVTTEYWVRLTGHCGTTPLNSPTMTASVCPTVTEPTATKQVVMHGTTTQLSIEAGGTRLEYQWYIGESGIKTNPIPNSNSPTITSPPITAATKFWCEVRSGGCPVPTPSIEIVLCSQPVVDWAHGDRYVAKSERVELRVNVNSTETPVLTFYSGTAGNVAGSTVVAGPTLSTTMAEYPTQTKTYWARGVEGDCHDDTTTLTVNVCVPTITQPLTGGMYVVGSGTPVPLSVTTDITPLGYQWYRGDVGYVSDPVGTTPSISVTPSVDTKYWVRLTACGGRTVDSAVALVTACNPPKLVSQTTSHWVTQGTTLDIHVHVDGTGVTHKWYKGVKGDTSIPVANPNSSWIRITPNETVSYWARSTGTCGVKDSETITISVCAPPEFTQPVVNPIFPGSQATITVNATTPTNTPLTYQWYSGTAGSGTAISGATSATYTTPVLSAPASYWVDVKAGDLRCMTASDTITVSMCAFPQQVSGSEIKIGLNETATLSLPPLSPVVGKNVTWYRGEAGDITTPVRSGVNASYTTPQLSVTTKYWAEFEYEGCVSRTTTYTVNVCKPSITTPPANKTIQSGQSAPLSIVTTNIAGQTITWYAGAVGTTTTVVGTGASISVSPTSTTNYWVRVSSCGLNVDSAAVTVTVCTPPTPTLVTPSPRYIKPGQSTSLQTYAPGSNLTYQWYVGTSGVTTNPIAGQTTDWYQASPATTTSYWCRITSYGTCVTNGPTITVDVCDNPVISVQPLSQRVFSGAATTLSVTATASRTLSYQWYRGTAGDVSNPIGAATSSPSVTVNPTAETSYWVRVINGVCTTDSATATVSICAFNPTYSGSEIKIGYNETATLSLPPLSPAANKNVSWYRGAVGDKANLVRAGVNVTYTTPALTATTTYWAEFEYEGCYSRTGAYTVNVCKPSITTPPTNKSIQSGQSASLSIVTTNIPGQTITWYAGAVGTTTTVAGTGANISVSPASTTSYWVRVSSCGLNADSAAVTVTVCTPPTPTLVTPSPRYIKPGQSTSLQTYAPGSNLTYQWYVGTSGVTTNPIAGQTTDWYQAAPAATTSYWCKITSYGTCVTNGPTITVDVCDNPVITAQPLSKRAFNGAATTLSVTATSSRTLSYQWYRGTAGDVSNPISGATSSSVTVNPTAETSYWVRVINGVCTTDSATATVSICTFNPTYGGSEIKIGWNETATLSLPTLSPVVNKNVWWYRGAVGDKTTLVRSGVNVTYTTPALNATTAYWAEFEYEGCYSRTGAYTVNVCKPSITTPPTNQSIVSGQSATLSITTTNIPGQTITWYSGAVGTTTTPVGTGPSITVSPTSTTNYWVRVSSCSLNADSGAVTVSVCTAPTISIVTPSPRYIKSGQLTHLQTYSPSPNVTYQWYLGTSGTTTSPVGTSSDWLATSPTSTTNYWCKVTSNGTCVTNGPTITVDVCNLPTISVQPQPQRIFSGKSATLSITASSPTHTLWYQWYRGDSGDVTNPVGTWTTSPGITVSPTTDTNYWVAVATAGGACVVYSNTVTVSMCTYPETVSGASYNTASGQSVTLTLPPMSPVDSKNVTWYQGAVGVKTTRVSWGINAGYTTPGLTTTTQYWAEFEHSGCVSRTGQYTVNVCKPTISAQPQSQVVFSGNTATLTVTATGAPLSYQWYRGNTGDVSQPVGTNSYTYTTPALTAGASYWVRITGCTVADSATATISVCTAPTVNSITKEPWTSIGHEGWITVNASGTNLSYQWYEGLSGDTSKPISGATNPTYTFIRQTSRYLWVRVTSSCNNAYVNSVATMCSVDPRITHETQSTTIPTGTSATFSVTAAGTYLSYQWYSDTTGAVAGATSNVFTTPALTQNTSYYCRVTSGTNGYDYSNWMSAWVCEGPNVPSVTSTQINATTWKLKANVDSWQMPETRYFWYKGPVGNVAASQYLGEQQNEYWAYNVTSSTTFWVRAMWLDESCWTDRGKTVP